MLARRCAEGFGELVAAVAGAVGGVEEPHDRLAAAGHGYVRFALAEPGVYTIMFRADVVDTDDPAYVAAGLAWFGQLAGLVADAQATAGSPPTSPATG